MAVVDLCLAVMGYTTPVRLSAGKLFRHAQVVFIYNSRAPPLGLPLFRHSKVHQMILNCRQRWHDTSRYALPCPGGNRRSHGTPWADVTRVPAGSRILLQGLQTRVDAG
jgi:hypothetical protein